jgi:hypothetical protein
MTEILNELVKVFDMYFKCSNCASTYHVINFKGQKDFECKDCKTFSSIPQEAKEKAAKERG